MAGVKGKSGGARPGSGGARPNSGGARPGSGRKPKDPELLSSELLLTSNPKQFLTALMNDSGADIKIRADAAKALLSAEVRSVEAKGKKEQANDAAKKVASRFSPAAPPKLVAAGGRKV